MKGCTEVGLCAAQPQPKEEIWHSPTDLAKAGPESKLAPCVESKSALKGTREPGIWSGRNYV